MDKGNKGFNQEQNEEHFDWEAFFTEEDAEQWEEEKARRKKRKAFTIKIVGCLLVLAMLVNGLAIWSSIINIPAISFIAISHRLSQNPEIEGYKKSIVTIEHNNVKGTGFNINSNGLIVTNEHVVKNANRVAVYFNAGESYVGNVIAKDRELDLAIVDIEANSLPVLTLEIKKEWKEGEQVLFIGNPLAYTKIANEGSIMGEVMLKDWEVPVLMIEAPVYKGNSGSPVMNQNGEVIGVIFGTLQNPSKKIVGVATPSYYIEEIVKKVTEKSGE